MTAATTPATEKEFWHKLDSLMLDIPIKTRWAIKDHVRARIHQEREKAGWRPIETAPKDGTKFFAYESDGEPEFYPCWWEDKGYGEAYWMDYADSEPNPTHWQPLPTPPALSQEERT